MMGNSMFSRFPYPNNYYPYYRNYGYVPNRVPQYDKNQSVQASQDEKCDDRHSKIQFEDKEKTKRTNSNSRSFGPIHLNLDNPFDLNQDEPIIEILGISLYLDDLIILGLLFFLYQEKIEDESLFFTLIMLLLS